MNFDQNLNFNSLNFTHSVKKLSNSHVITINLTFDSLDIKEKNFEIKQNF